MNESGESPAASPADSPDRRFKRPESVLVVVHTSQHVLLLRRADHPEFWQSVTGSMQWSEASPLDTAVRELAEETGLDVQLAQLRDWRLTRRYTIFPQWRHRYAPGTLENTEHLFSLEVPPGAPIRINPAEHTEFAWLPFREAAERAFSWTNRAAIEALLAEQPGRDLASGP